MRGHEQTSQCHFTTTAHQPCRALNQIASPLIGKELMGQCIQSKGINNARLLKNLNSGSGNARFQTPERYFSDGHSELGVPDTVIISLTNFVTGNLFNVHLIEQTMPPMTPWNLCTESKKHEK